MIYTRSRNSFFPCSVTSIQTLPRPQRSMLRSICSTSASVAPHARNSRIRVASLETVTNGLITVFASSARQWTLQPFRDMKLTKIRTGEV